MAIKEELQSGFDNFKSEIIVKGKSTIDHNHRVRIGVSCDGYVLLDYLSEAKHMFPIKEFYEKI